VVETVLKSVITGVDGGGGGGGGGGDPLCWHVSMKASSLQASPLQQQYLMVVAPPAPFLMEVPHTDSGITLFIQPAVIERPLPLTSLPSMCSESVADVIDTMHLSWFSPRLLSIVSIE